MGDRSNIVVDDGTGRVYLYGHWMGSFAIRHTVHGLESDRVNDPSYLARIIFDDMIAEDRGSTTGYGISSSITDNEYPLIVIRSAYSAAVEVWLEDEDGSELTPRLSVEDFLPFARSVVEEGFDQHELVQRIVAGVGDPPLDTTVALTWDTTIVENHSISISQREWDEALKLSGDESDALATYEDESTKHGVAVTERRLTNA